MSYFCLKFILELTVEFKVMLERKAGNLYLETARFY